MKPGVTLNYLHDKHRQPDWVAYEYPAWPVLSGREPIGRLSLRSTPPIETTYTEYVRLTSGGTPPGQTYFLDTCFLTQHEVPLSFWEFLIKHNVVITPGVWHELEIWRNNPKCNHDFRDLLAEASTTSP